MDKTMRSLILLLAVALSVPAVAQERSPVTNMAPIISAEPATRLVRLKSNGPIPAAVQNAAKSVCRVRVDGQDGSGYMGSGTYIGHRTIVTARHVVRGGVLTTARAEFGRSQFFAAGWLANKEADQYLLQLKEEPPFDPVPIAQQEPAQGETVYAMGFGHDKFEIWPARLTSYGSAVSQRDSGHYTGPHASRSGDSGGAVVNARGEYVGTIWGGVDRDCVAVTYTHTRSFFQRCGLLGRLLGPRIQQEQTTITQFCPGGQCQLNPPIQNQPPSSSLPAPDYFDEPAGQPTPANCDCTCVSMSIDEIASAVEGRINCEPGPAGERGPKGEPGRDGKDAELTREDIAEIIAAVKDAILKDPSMRGPAGKDAVITDALIAEVAGRAAAMVPVNNRRVLLVDGSTKQVIDDETYGPNDPIVLDVQAILNAAKQRQ
jgi:hypothetical protein